MRMNESGHARPYFSFCKDMLNIIIPGINDSEAICPEYKVMNCTLKKVLALSTAPHPVQRSQFRKNAGNKKRRLKLIFFIPPEPER
jgi:hypothetical protein